LVLALACPLLGAAEVCEVKGTAPACTATAASPVAICFAEQPLLIDHCGPQIAPNFSIDIWHPADGPSVGYRYSYQLIVNGRPQPVERFFDDANPDAHPFTDSPDLTAKRLTYLGPNKYALRVSVVAEGQPERTELSTDVDLEDRPRIRGLAVGISNYANPRFNLNYADEDAKAFKAVMTELLKASADIRIDLHTSDTNDEMTKDKLLQTIREVSGDGDESAGDDELLLSGPNDWYVFYFSGHGVVGVNPQREVGRYLSTKQFDPNKLSRTAIRISDLASALYATSAKNILVILDSCFSGSHFHPDGPAAGPQGRTLAVPEQLVKRSGKVIYSANGKATSIPVGGDGDAQVLNNTADMLEGQRRRALFLSAASANRPAEEGPVSYTRQDGALELEFNRASVQENAGIRGGHGLYTFAWLANLIAQLPKRADVPPLLPGGRAPAGNSSDCQLNFDGAASRAKADIEALGLFRGWPDLQVPESRPTTTMPLRVGCVVSLKETP
jgi:hypothetical protein